MAKRSILHPFLMVFFIATTGFADGKAGEPRVFEEPDTLLLISAIMASRTDFPPLMQSEFRGQRRILTSATIAKVAVGNGESAVQIVLFAKDAKKRRGYSLEIDSKPTADLKGKLEWISSRLQVFDGENNFQDAITIMQGAQPGKDGKAFDAGTLDLVTSLWLGYFDLLTMTSAGRDPIDRAEIKNIPNKDLYYLHGTEASFRVKYEKDSRTLAVKRWRSQLAGPEAPFLHEIIKNF